MKPIPPKRRELTAREKLMRKKYTRTLWVDHGVYGLFLQIEVQGFRVGGDFCTKNEAEWTRDMLAIALARIEL